MELTKEQWADIKSDVNACFEVISKKHGLNLQIGRLNSRKSTHSKYGIMFKTHIGPKQNG